MKNIESMMKKYDVEIRRCVHSGYNNPKEQKELDEKYPKLCSTTTGKYHYFINGFSVVRFIPRKHIGTKNWLFNENGKMTPYYEVLVGNNTPTFWSLEQVVKFIKKYQKGEIKFDDYEEDEFEDEYDDDYEEDEFEDEM